eukprot:gene8547-9420_t
MRRDLLMACSLLVLLAAALCPCSQAFPPPRLPLRIASQYSKEFATESPSCLWTKKKHDDHQPVMPTKPEVPRSKEEEMTRAKLLLLGVAALYGTDFTCVKVLGTVLHPAVAATCRFSIAAAVFLPQLLRTFKSNRPLMLGGAEVGLYAALGYFGQALALLTSHASNVAFLCSLSVVVVPILEALWGERRGWSYLGAAIVPASIAVAGVACLELGGDNLPRAGDLWACLQPIFFGLSYWRIEKHMKKCNGSDEAQAFTAILMIVVALCSFIWMMAGFVLPISRYGDEIFWTSITSQITALFNDWRVPAALAWTGIVTTALTSFGENIAMKKLDAAESTVIYSTEPLWGTAFAAVTLHETIGWNTGIGAVLVLAACLWSIIGPSSASIVSFLAVANLEGIDFSELVDNILMNIAKLMNFVPELLQ